MIINFVSFFVIFNLYYFVSVSSHTFTVKNQCRETIWVGVYGDNEIPANGGFVLNPGHSRSFNARAEWRGGRIWGRTGCNSNGQNCETGDCGGLNCRKRTTFDAVTLAEFGLNAWNGLDFWDISQVDGFNLPIEIRPVRSTVENGNGCRNINCKFNLPSACPDRFKQFGRNRNLVACKSACTATREGRFCCPEPQYNRNNCPQPTEESRIFKRQCPDAYSHAYDDDTSTFACKSKTPNSSSYEVIFCP